LAVNLKKLQSIARRKLDLKGQIEWNPVPKIKELGREYLSTRTTAGKHVISYTDVSSLEPVDAFHEMCKAKLNELGFTTVEAAALDAMRECCKDDPNYIRDANSAQVIVLEACANSILFSIFPEESRVQREKMVLRFESSDALTTLHTQRGFWGTAGVCYYLAASRISGTLFPEDLVEKAIARASDGDQIKKEYDAINLLLKELPMIDTSLKRIPDEDSIKIADVMLRLFSGKTGLECE
jgi:hypothetical protein